MTIGDGIFPVAYAQSIQRVAVCDPVRSVCADIRPNGALNV